jgi:CPA2 family monovalent cation:H+ antiporter-2
MIMLGLPDQQVRDRVDEVRRNRYRLLHGFYQHTDDNRADPINPD